MGELAEACQKQGDEAVKITRKVTYHDAVAYTIQGADKQDSKGE
jgi:hypothetical protein